MPWYSEYIEQVPGVAGGEPIVKDTRISVLAVVEYWELYGSLARVAEIFPDVPQEHVRAALAYYQDHRDEIEHYRREHDESDLDAKSASNIFKLSA